MRYLSVGTAKRISKIGLGTFQFGSPEWGYGERYATTEAYRIVRRAVELGVTLFDTAEIYGFGRSERILGRALGDDREAVFIATKLFPLLPVARVVQQRAAASANRLGVARLDLYQVHWSNPFMGDLAIMRGMRRLQEEGLVDEVGVSGYGAERWRAAEAALGGRLLTNQVGYSLLQRSPEQELLPLAESTGRAIVAFSPLAQGLLSGRYHGGPRPDNFRARDPRFDPRPLDSLHDVLETLRQIGRAHDATPAQIALAWAIRHPNVTAIPGASSVEQLELNVAAAEIQLTDGEDQALRSASDRFVSGAPADPSPRRDLTAARHALRGARYLARTVGSDLRHDRGQGWPRPGSPDAALRAPDEHSRRSR